MLVTKNNCSLAYYIVHTVKIITHITLSTEIVLKYETGTVV